MAHVETAPRHWLRRPRPAPPATLDELLAPARWQRKVGDPELRKALAYLQATIGEIRRLLALEATEVTLCTAQVKARLRDTLDRPVSSLTIDSAWELYSELKSLLPIIGDADYVASQLDHEAERGKDPSRWHPWTKHFSDSELERLRKNYELEKPHPRLHAQAAAKLAFLYQRRAEAGRERRARAAQKRRYLLLLAPVLLALQAGLAVTINTVADESEIWRQILVTGTAGALGATLAGTRKIRDDLRELDDLRSFWPAMFVQPLVGATAGLIVLLVIETGTLDVGGDSGSWAGRALVAFAAGFSEPFFIGLVQHVAVIPDKKSDAETAATEASAEDEGVAPEARA